MDDNIVIVLPEQDRGYLSSELYHLSELLAKRNPEEQAHGLLGGEFGYGQEFQNEVFEMFPFYWGECEDGYHNPRCPGGDKCYAERPNFRFYSFDFEVIWYKYIGRGMEVNKNLSRAEMRKMFQDCENSLA